MRRAGRFLRGAALLRVTGADTASFLRRCAESGLLLEEAEQEDRFTCRLTLPLRDLETARRAAERSGCALRVLQRTGLPQAAARARRRVLLAVGALIVTAALVASSLFVWEIEVTENDTALSDGEILRVLAVQGVGVGSFWPGFHPDLIRSRALAALPELSWIAVNLSGTRAFVQVRPRVSVPAIRDPRQPVDVTAAAGGVVTAITVLEGTPLVRRGDAVEPGQVLISADRPIGAAGRERTVHAAGEVRARTWHELTLCAMLHTMEKTEKGAGRLRMGLLLGEKLFFFSRNSGIPPADCDKITKIQRLGIPGLFSLPIALVTEREQPFTLREEERSPEELRAELEAELSELLQRKIGEEGEVVSVFFTESRNDGLMTLTLRAECEERIDREVPRG